MLDEFISTAVFSELARFLQVVSKATILMLGRLQYLLISTVINPV